MFGRNSFAALPRGNATALQEKKAQQKKSGEILCHLCLEDTFLLRAAHDDYSFSTRSAPQFYERWTSAERRKAVAGIYPCVILFIKYGLTRYMPPFTFSTEPFFLFRISKSYAYPHWFSTDPTIPVSPEFMENWKSCINYFVFRLIFTIFVAKFAHLRSWFNFCFREQSWLINW